MQDNDATKPEPTPRGDDSRLGTRTIESAELFAGARTIEITHDGQTYRLLITKNNKLILQK